MNKRDFTDIIGGLFLTALGLFFAIYAQRYSMGTLNRMGPGYFPVVLGAIMALLGLLVAVPAWSRAGVGPDVSWKTMFIVIGSVVLFGATLQTVGLMFTSMLTVVVASGLALEQLSTDNAGAMKLRRFAPHIPTRHSQRISKHLDRHRPHIARRIVLTIATYRVNRVVLSS